MTTSKARPGPPARPHLLQELHHRGVPHVARPVPGAVAGVVAGVDLGAQVEQQLAAAGNTGGGGEGSEFLVSGNGSEGSWDDTPRSRAAARSCAAREGGHREGLCWSLFRSVLCPSRVTQQLAAAPRGNLAAAAGATLRLLQAGLRKCAPLRPLLQPLPRPGTLRPPAHPSTQPSNAAKCSGVLPAPSTSFTLCPWSTACTMAAGGRAGGRAGGVVAGGWPVESALYFVYQGCCKLLDACKNGAPSDRPHLAQRFAQVRSDAPPRRPLAHPPCPCWPLRGG